MCLRVREGAHQGDHQPGLRGSGICASASSSSPFCQNSFHGPNIISNYKDNYFNRISLRVSARFAFTATLRKSGRAKSFVTSEGLSLVLFLKTFSNFFHLGFLAGVFLPHDFSVRWGSCVCVHSCERTHPIAGC